MSLEVGAEIQKIITLNWALLKPVKKSITNRYANLERFTEN